MPKQKTSKTVPIKFATLGNAGAVKLSIKYAKSKSPKVWCALEFDEATKEKFDARVQDWREAHGLTEAQAREAYCTHLLFCELAKVEIAQMRLEQSKGLSA